MTPEVKGAAPPPATPLPSVPLSAIFDKGMMGDTGSTGETMAGDGQTGAAVAGGGTGSSLAASLGAVTEGWTKA